MSLSKENYDSLDENYLYKLTPVREPDETYIGTIPISYWCKNWTFKVRKNNIIGAVMVDTYYDSITSHCIQVTDENIHDFEVIFDFRNVTRITKEIAEEYNRDAVFCVAVDSGGINYPTWFVKDGAKKSRSKQMAKKKEEIRCLKSDLEYAERELMGLGAGQELD